MKKLFLIFTVCMLVFWTLIFPRIKAHYDVWDAERQERWREAAAAQVGQLESKGFSNIISAHFGDEWFAEKSGKIYKVIFADESTSVIRIQEITKTP